MSSLFGGLLSAFGAGAQVYGKGMYDIEAKKEEEQRRITSDRDTLSWKAKLEAEMEEAKRTRLTGETDARRATPGTPENDAATISKQTIEQNQTKLDSSKRAEGLLAVSSGKGDVVLPDGSEVTTMADGRVYHASKGGESLLGEYKNKDEFAKAQMTAKERGELDKDQASIRSTNAHTKVYEAMADGTGRYAPKEKEGKEDRLTDVEKQRVGAARKVIDMAEKTKFENGTLTPEQEKQVFDANSTIVRVQVKPTPEMLQSFKKQLIEGGFKPEHVEAYNLMTGDITAADKVRKEAPAAPAKDDPKAVPASVRKMNNNQFPGLKREVTNFRGTLPG